MMVRLRLALTWALVGVCSMPVPAAARAVAAAPLQVRWVRAQPTAGGIVVTGFVRRTLARPGPVPGFVRISAPQIDGQGDVVTCLRSGDLRPAGSRGATFAVVLAGALRAEGAMARYVPDCD